VTSGTFTDGTSIAFKGVQVAINGAPAAADKFDISPAGTSSVFATMSGLITTLNSANSSPQLATHIGGSLQQIDNAITNLSNVQASVGARLNSISSSQTTAQSTQVSLQTSVSQLSDVDYAAAITQLNTEEVSLQAAQASYASIAKLSLFNYLN
jgi:flagellar hook-associated protein 3 FlgL